MSWILFKVQEASYIFASYRMLQRIRTGCCRQVFVVSGGVDAGSVDFWLPPKNREQMTEFFMSAQECIDSKYVKVM